MITNSINVIITKIYYIAIIVLWYIPKLWPILPRRDRNGETSEIETAGDGLIFCDK
jgi:hypothetical protein